MSRKPNPPPDDKEQAARFIETAEALGVDDRKKLFEDALRVLTPIKPTKKTKKPP